MTQEQTVRYEMLRRVRNYGEAHREQFPVASAGGKALAVVAAAVDELGQYAATKMSTAREGRRTKKTARQALASRLDAVARTARVIAHTSPGFDDAFLVPRPRKDQVLLTAGRVFIHDAEPVAAQFIGHGLPETFIAVLKECLEQFERSLGICEAGARQQASARAGITAALTAGVAAVRALDVIVVNQCGADGKALAAWARERHVNASRRARATATQPPATEEVSEVSQ